MLGKSLPERSKLNSSSLEQSRKPEPFPKSPIIVSKDNLNEEIDQWAKQTTEESLGIQIKYGGYEFKLYTYPPSIKFELANQPH